MHERKGRFGSHVTLLSQWIKFACQAVAFVALSRLLTQEDFGLVAMVLPVVTFASMFAEFGLFLAGIQARSLSQAQKSALFYLNFAAGSLAALVIVLAGPVLSVFYGRPEMTAIAVALAGPLIVTSLSIQFRVELNRNRRYTELAVHDVLSAVIGLATALFSAAVGLGYWALILQTAAQAITQLFLAVMRARWRPGAPRRVEVRALLSFGGDNLALQSVNLVSRSVDTMALGRAAGADAAGLYGRSTQLLNLIFQQLVSPLTRVVMPKLAQVGDGFQDLLLRYHSASSAALLFAISLLFSFADPVLPLVLGDDWVEMPSIVKILCVGSVLQAVGYSYYWAFLAKGESRVYLLTELPGRALMVVGFVIAAPHGPIALASVASAGQMIILAAGTFMLRRIRVSSILMARATLAPVVLFGGATFSASIAPHFFPTEGFHSMMVIGAAWCVGLLVALLIAPQLRRELRTMLSQLRPSE